MADGNNRTPKSLQGLFNFCIEATKSEDVESSTQFQAMTDEDKQFINDAMRAAMGSDPVKQMVDNLKVLTQEGEEPQIMVDALESLQTCCENMDLANDFHKIGGYEVLPFLLQHLNSELRWRTADLVATLVQNNDYSQRQILDQGFMALLLNRLDQDPDNNVRIKMLYAVSCLSRDFEPAQEELIKLDGFSPLMRAMQVNSDKLQTKTAFLLAYLCSTQHKFKETLCNMGFVEQLVALLHQPHKEFHEHIMRALQNLTEDHPPGVRECQRSELNLQSLLRERIQSLKDQPESQEEVEYANTLLVRCFPDQSNSVER